MKKILIITLCLVLFGCEYNNGETVNNPQHQEEETHEIDRRPCEDVSVIEIKSEAEIHSSYSNDSSTIGKAQVGEFYVAYEECSDNGDTWYRVGEDQWILFRGGHAFTVYGSGPYPKTVNQLPYDKNLNEPIIKLYINSEIRIRSSYTINSEIVGHVYKGDYVLAYEEKSNEGYTWYRIGKDQWVANNGSWLDAYGISSDINTLDNDNQSQANPQVSQPSQQQNNKDIMEVFNSYYKQNMSDTVLMDYGPTFYINYLVTNGWSEEEATKCVYSSTVDWYTKGLNVYLYAITSKYEIGSDNPFLSKIVYENNLIFTQYPDDLRKRIINSYEATEWWDRHLDEYLNMLASRYSEADNSFRRLCEVDFNEEGAKYGATDYEINYLTTHRDTNYGCEFYRQEN